MYVASSNGEYHIMQIVCGGKLTRLQCLVEIRGKTFTFVMVAS